MAPRAPLARSSRSPSFPIDAAIMALGALLFVGCASRGDQLARAGSYVEAVAAYDEDLVAQPRDPALVSKRDAARSAALSAKLDEAERLRHTAHPEHALSPLHEAITLEARWRFALPGPLAGKQQALMTALAVDLPRFWIGDTRNVAPLTGRERWSHFKLLLEPPAMAPVRAALEARVHEAAQQRCHELAGDDSVSFDARPYLGGMILAYCAGVGADDAAMRQRLTRPRPELRGGLLIAGSVKNTRSEEQHAFEGWLRESFAASPWYDHDVPAIAGVKLGGRYDADLAQKQVRLYKEYTRVTRMRVSDPLEITNRRQRIEHNAGFEYDALQFMAHYDVGADVRFDFSPQARALSLRADRHEVKQSLQVDTTFPPADVYPTRANLPSVGQWLDSYLAGRRISLVRKLEGHWKRTFCSTSTFTPEEAARCLRVREASLQAMAALKPVFGEDTQLFLQAFWHAQLGQEEKAPAPPDASKPPPKEPPRAAPSLGDLPADEEI